MNGFGQRAPHLSKCELSKLLLDYAVHHLRTQRQMCLPTQDQIAEELQISQALVSSVINGRKYFGRETFKKYADSREMSESELLETLLAISPNYPAGEAVDELERSQGNPRILVSRSLELWARLESERSLAAQDPHRTFDADRAYCEIVLSMIETLRLQGAELRGAAVLAVSKDDMSIFGAGISAKQLADCRCVERVRPTNLWKEAAEKTCEPREFRGHLDLSARFVKSCNCNGSPESMTEFLFGKVDAAEDETPGYLQCFPIFSDSTLAESKRGGGLRLVLVVLTPDKESSNRINETVAVYGRIAERVALFSVQERLLCAEVILGDDTRNPAVLSPTLRNRRRPLEHFENGAQELVKAVCENPDWRKQVAAVDLWLYDSVAREFISPNEHFRWVGLSHRDRTIVSQMSGRETFLDLYSREFNRLRPRPCGKTMYMIANRTGLIINRAAGCGESMIWSGVPELNCGTYLGIPLLMQTRYQTDRVIAGVLSMRCLQNIDLDKAQRIIAGACQLICSLKLCVISPLLSAGESTQNRILGRSAAALFAELALKKHITKGKDVCVEVWLESAGENRRGQKRISKKSTTVSVSGRSVT